MRSNSLMIIFRLLQWATVALFLGRAWQHLFFDAPFRILLWDEAWMKGIVQGIFKTPWQDYITSLVVDDAIQWSIKGIGIFYLVCALVAAFIGYLPKWVAKLMWFGSFSLLILAFLYCKERFFSIGQFFEYSLQFVSPLLLYFWVYPKWSDKTFRMVMKIAIACTFICHGLYAINYYPRPGSFVDMVINTLGVSETNAHLFLFMAGLMDFVVGVIIFLPREISRIALGYIVLWGIATTFARFTAYVEWDYLQESLQIWTWQVLIRIPHFLIPIALYYFLKARKGIQIPISQRKIRRKEQPTIFPET